MKLFDDMLRLIYVATKEGDKERETDKGKSSRGAAANKL